VFESVFPLMCACALPPRQFAQFYLILAHLQHCKFNTAYIYIYRIALLTLVTHHCLCVCIVSIYAWLRNCMSLVRNKTNIYSVYNFLGGNTEFS